MVLKVIIIFSYVIYKNNVLTISMNEKTRTFL